MPLVLGVDSSTQATKVEVRDVDDGRLVASGRAAHTTTSPPRSETHPDVWASALAAARAAAGPPAADVVAVAVAGQQHGLVALGAAGEVLRPAKLWNDTESAPDADWLVERLGGPGAWAEACGSVPVAAFTVAKLSWLHRCEPATWERLARVCLPHDWLNLRLTGRLCTDHGDASGTGYFSPAEGRWRLDLLGVVDDERDWSGALPDLLEPGEAAGTTRIGDRDVLVAAGTGDNMAAALALGLRTGDVAVSLGTSGTVYAVSDRPTADGSGAVAGFADAAGRFLPLVCTSNATGVTDAVAEWLAVDRQALEELATGAVPGSGGVVLVPHLAGERTPNRPTATGTWAGLRLSTGRAELARAAYEGVVCGLLDGLDALGAAGVATDGRLHLVGGGARSPVYRHVVADLAGRSVTVPAADELVAAGACVQAAACWHGRPGPEVAEAWDLARGEVVEPDAGVDAAAVRAAYARVRA